MNQIDYDGKMLTLVQRSLSPASLVHSLQCGKDEQSGNTELQAYPS